MKKNDSCSTAVLTAPTGTYGKEAFWQVRFYDKSKDGTPVLRDGLASVDAAKEAFDALFKDNLASVKESGIRLGADVVDPWTRETAPLSMHAIERCLHENVRVYIETSYPQISMSFLQGPINEKENDLITIEMPITGNETNTSTDGTGTATERTAAIISLKHVGIHTVVDMRGINFIELAEVVVDAVLRWSDTIIIGIADDLANGSFGVWDAKYFTFFWESILRAYVSQSWLKPEQRYPMAVIEVDDTIKKAAFFEWFEEFLPKWLWDIESFGGLKGWHEFMEKEHPSY